MKESLHVFFNTLRKPWLLLLFAFCGMAKLTLAQDSKGTDFWICFPGNLGSPVPQLYITSEQVSSVTIAIPGLAFNQVVNVPAGGLQVVNLPSTAQVQSQFVAENKGIRITATNEVTVYGMNAQNATTDAFLAFPLDAIGMDYYILGYNKDFSFSNPTQATIVATENNTTVTITTTVSGGGFTAGVPASITLQQGQVYQLRSLNTNADYSGTRVASNKPISVFGGAQCTNISGNLRACDHLVEQLPPLSSWGRSFVTVPLATRLAGDVFRFLAQTNGTVVNVNGSPVATLNAGQIHEMILGSNSYNRITSNNPILVGQYSRSSEADNVTSDPFFALVPPDEQFLNNYTISAGTSNIPNNFINITSPTSNTGNVRVDGAAVNPSLWVVIPGSSFSGAKVPVATGVRRVTSPLPIGVLVYGFGSFDSYGYLGGQSFSAVATVTTVTLSPKTGMAPVGTEQCFEATVQDQFGNVVPGVRVDFTITGPNAGSSGFAFANAIGVAQFCYTGTNLGTDNIVASVGGLSDNGTFTWTTSCANCYYSKPAGDLHNVLTWGVNPDGSGANPPDFGTGKTFQLANRPGIYTMTGNWSVGGIINIPSGSQLQINGNTLSLTDLAGNGTITGSLTSNLIVIGSDGGNVTLNFTGGGQMLNDLTVNRTGTGASATLGTPLHLFNVLTLSNGTLNTGNQLTLKSTATNTARVAPIMTGSILGTATVERYIPARRAWRILSAPVGGVTGAAIGGAGLAHNQESVVGTMITSSGTPRPVSYGTATFSLNEAQTALTVSVTVYNIDITGTQTPSDNNDNLTAAHIHVGAPPGVNAPVRWGFFGAPDNDVNPKQLVITPFPGGVGGTFTSTWDLMEGNGGTTLTTNLPAILAGQAYINFHTAQFPGGEIRGQIYMAGTGTQTVNQAWQEGSILGVSANPNPAPGYGTHITGGPVFGSTANGFDQNPVGANSSLKIYNSTLNTWVDYPNTLTTPVGGTAFMTFIRGDRGINLSFNDVPPTPTTLRATGPLKVGDQTFAVAGTGFTAIPNPFASPINFATITRNGVQNNFYVWDPKMGGANGVGAYVLISFNGSSYDVIPSTAISPMSQYIQSGQGFLVRPSTPGTAGSITIKESDKSATSAMDVFRTRDGSTVSNTGAPIIANPKDGQGIRISLQTVNNDRSAAVLDEVFVSYQSHFSDQLDVFDARKAENMQENLALVSEGETLMAERRAALKEGDVLKLKLWNTTPNSYLFEVNPTGLLGGGLTAVLEDQFLKLSTPVSLSEKTQIQFAITSNPASARADRFQLRIVKAGLENGFTKNSISAYPNPVVDRNISLFFDNKPAGRYEVMIVNSLGQVVFRRFVQHAGGSAMQALYLDKMLTKGTYQLRVEGGGETTNISIVSNQ